MPSGQGHLVDVHAYSFDLRKKMAEDEERGMFTGNVLVPPVRPLHQLRSGGAREVLTGGKKASRCRANGASLRVIEKLGTKPIGDINPNAPDAPYHGLHREDSFADAWRREG